MTENAGQQTALQSIAVRDGFQKVYWDTAEGRISAGRVLAVRQRLQNLGRRGRPAVWHGRAERLLCRNRRALDGRHVRLWVGNERGQTGPNPYGFVPFVHFPNLPDPGEQWGRSELVDVVNLARSYNERVSDQADTIRYHSDPPVVFKGGIGAH